MIVAQTLTDQDVDDPSQAGPLLNQIDEMIGQVQRTAPMMATTPTKRLQRMATASRTWFRCA